MIYAICGRPRSGKSYESVVYHIIPAIQAKRKVVTNVSLNIDWFKKMFGDSVVELISVVDGQLNEFGKLNRPFSQFEHYQDDWRDENNKAPLYVIDEAHMVLPNRNLDSKILEFYSLHGHYGIDIILLTQDLRKIHRDVKAMIEMTYYCAKNTAFGSDKTYTKKVRIGATTEVINEEVRKYKSAYFPAYQSHTQSKGSVAEVMANDVTPIWKRWPFLGAAVFLLLGPSIFIYALTRDKEEPEQPAVQQAASQQTEISDSSGTQDEETKTKSSKRKKNSKDFGPLDGFEMYVTGYSKQMAYKSKSAYSGELDWDLSFYKIYIAVFQDGIKRFDFEHLDLLNIGYTFTALSECVYQVEWGEVSKIITCQDFDNEESKSDNPLDRVATLSF
jgi:zona occludens toxin